MNWPWRANLASTMHAPVTHENFRQWVIEDAFCAGRPDWDKVGATFTDDVHDYEAMKIRILNAGHQVIANAGEILSVETIAGCMEHPADPRAVPQGREDRDRAACQTRPGHDARRLCRSD